MFCVFSSQGGKMAEKFIVAKGKYGLGNRIKSIALAVVYGQVTNRRVAIDWTDERYSNGPNVFPLLFDCDLVDQSIDWHSSQSVAPKSWSCNLHRDAESMSGLIGIPRSQIERQLSISPRRLYDEDVVVLIASRISDQVFRCLASRPAYPPDWPRNPNEFMRWFVRGACQPAISIRDHADHLRKSMFDGRDTLGVHVRFTDNWSRRQYDPMTVFGPHCDAHLSTSDAAAIYLATDNQNVERQFLDHYNDRCIVIPKRWPSKIGKPLHAHDSQSDRLQIAKEAITEIILLSHCRRIASKHSTFADYAMLLSESDSHIRLGD